LIFDEKVKMIRHVVLLKIRDAAEAPILFAALRTLQTLISGIADVKCGADCSPEGLQRGFTHGFTVDFVDASARDAYVSHPAHQKVGALIVAACEGGVDGVLVLDWGIKI
jgi:Stress responsive A/B Barrel Domain